MICNVLIAVLTLSMFGSGRANFTACCESKAKTTATLDWALQLINSVRDNYPICDSKCLPLDCEDILSSGENKSGIYEVWPRSRVIKGPLRVYCDMDTDGGGWTVIQRRGNYSRPKDFFYKDWQSYKEGFGNIKEDFWLGNDNIYGLSNQKLYSARFDLADVEGSRRYAVYDHFWIDDEDHQYTLHIEGYRGNAGDSIRYHNRQKFSTKDRDNDQYKEGSCAERYKGAWWYKECQYSNLNGLYHGGKYNVTQDGVIWHSWKGSQYSLGFTEIKIRAKDFVNEPKKLYGDYRENKS